MKTCFPLKAAGAEITGCEVVFGRVEKSGENPLFGEEEPWEVRFDNMYPNVLYDPDREAFFCFYNPFIVDPATELTPPDFRFGKNYSRRMKEIHEQIGGGLRETGLCLAESDDGISWRKPGLDKVLFDRSWKNNLLERQVHGTGVFRDSHETDPDRIYKMVRFSEETREFSVSFGSGPVRWSRPVRCPGVEHPGKDDGDAEVFWSGDTHNNAVWAPTLGKYVLITRMWERSARLRLVGRSESDDFIRWTVPEPVIGADGREKQVYSMPIFYHAGLYWGLPAVYNRETDFVTTGLAVSPDTRSWEILRDGSPFIPNSSLPGDIDYGCVYASPPVITENGFRFYYAGSTDTHYAWRRGFLCLAELPADRLAGAASLPGKDAAVEAAVPDGDWSTLEVNGPAAGGEFAVTLLSREGRPVTRGRLEKDPAGTGPYRKVLLDAAGIPKGGRVRFSFRGGVLYSWRFT